MSFRRKVAPLEGGAGRLPERMAQGFTASPDTININSNNDNNMNNTNNSNDNMSSPVGNRRVRFLCFYVASPDSRETLAIQSAQSSSNE